MEWIYLFYDIKVWLASQVSWYSHDYVVDSLIASSTLGELIDTAMASWQVIKFFESVLAWKMYYCLYNKFCFVLFFYKNKIK